MDAREHALSRSLGQLAELALAIEIEAGAQGFQRSASVELPHLYPAQQQIKREARRFNVLNIGRRAGKTYLGIHLALETAATGSPVGWFAPNYKYLLEVWQTLTHDLRPLATKVNATERRIELRDDGVVECWTLDGTDDPGRSRKYKRVIIDEAAIAPNLKAAWEEGIRPTLTDLQGDAWFLSTPKGLNYFFDLFKRGQDELAHPDWRSWQMPSSVNPYLPPAELEAAAYELPALVYQQEYLAEFLQAEGAVFRNLDACLRAPKSYPPDHQGHLLVAGVDWGQQHDFTAISIVCCHCEREVCLDRFNKIGWDFQRRRILTICQLWGVSVLLVEKNSIGSPNLEALQLAAPESLNVAGFETTAKSKPKLIQSFALDFERAALQWLPDPVARHELAAYEATVTESGYTKYGAPEGGFDDTVICRALSARLARERTPVPLSRPQQIEAAIDPRLRVGAEGEWTEGREMARAWALQRAEDEIKRREFSQWEEVFLDTV